MAEQPRKTSEEEINELDKACEILQSIAKAYPQDSEEVRAIRVAAVACTAVQRHAILRKAYHTLRTVSGTRFPDEMKMRLKQAGVDIDEYGDDQFPLAP